MKTMLLAAALLFAPGVAMADDLPTVTVQVNEWCQFAARCVVICSNSGDGLGPVQCRLGSSDDAIDWNARRHATDCGVLCGSAAKIEPNIDTSPGCTGLCQFNVRGQAVTCFEDGKSWAPDPDGVCRQPSYALVTVASNGTVSVIKGLTKAQAEEMARKLDWSNKCRGLPNGSLCAMDYADIVQTEIIGPGE